MDIDKLILTALGSIYILRFSSLMDIDKLIPEIGNEGADIGFSSLMDIDKLIPVLCCVVFVSVLVL